MILIPRLVVCGIVGFVIGSAISDLWVGLILSGLFGAAFMLSFPE